MEGHKETEREQARERDKRHLRNRENAEQAENHLCAIAVAFEEEVQHLDEREVLHYVGEAGTGQAGTSSSGRFCSQI